MTPPIPSSSRVCAWRGDVMERNVPGLTAPSHGICSRCEHEHFPDLPERPSGAGAVPGLTSNVGAIAVDMAEWR